MLASALNLFFSALYLLLIIRVIWSWVDPSPFSTNPVKRVVWTTTDPILIPLRRIIPPLGMFDISPLVALILLEIVQRALLAFLIH